MSRGGAFLASLLITTSRPTWWLLALAGFLVRGGFAAFVVPIVLLPSPLAISNVVAPIVVPVALGRVGPEVIALVAVAVGSLLAWLIVGGWVAAATDLALIRDAAGAAVDEGVRAEDGDADGRSIPADRLRPGRSQAGQRRDRVLIGRMLAARLVAWLPLCLALAVATVRAVEITYVELTRPFEVATPLVVRVVQGAVPEITLVALAWLLGELLGGLAARRIALDGLSAVRALLAATGDVVRRPATAVLPWLGLSFLFFVILGGTIAAASIAWSRVILALAPRPVEPVALALDLLLFVAIWLAALAVGGVFAAARASAQTFEDVRRRAATGTFGASAHHRSGDWSLPDEGGSL
jgi:hypothetical protein